MDPLVPDQKSDCQLVTSCRPSRLFEAKGHAMQIPEILEGIGVAVFSGTTVRDLNFLCDVGELCQ